VITQDNHNASHLSTEIEVTRLAAQVHGGMRQTKLVSQAVTRMAAEVRCVADEANALAAEIGAFAGEYAEGPALETPHGE
jgi:fructose/tagatose bisphosphate aldolase